VLGGLVLGGSVFAVGSTGLRSREPGEARQLAGSESRATAPRRASPTPRAGRISYGWLTKTRWRP